MMRYTEWLSGASPWTTPGRAGRKWKLNKCSWPQTSVSERVTGSCNQVLEACTASFWMGKTHLHLQCSAVAPFNEGTQAFFLEHSFALLLCVLRRQTPTVRGFRDTPTRYFVFPTWGRCCFRQSNTACWIPVKCWGMGSIHSFILPILCLFFNLLNVCRTPCML